MNSPVALANVQMCLLVMSDNRKAQMMYDEKTKASVRPRKMGCFKEC